MIRMFTCGHTQWDHDNNDNQSINQSINQSMLTPNTTMTGPWNAQLVPFPVVIQQLQTATYIPMTTMSVRIPVQR